MKNLCLNRWLSRLRVVCNIMPIWWNWQTRLTQNQVRKSVGSSPTIGTNYKNQLKMELSTLIDFYKKICYNIYVR